MKYQVSRDKADPNHEKVLEVLRKHKAGFEGVPDAEKANVFVKTVGKGSPQEYVDVVVYIQDFSGSNLLTVHRKVFVNLGVQINELLELAPGTTGAGHARFANGLSLDLADAFGVKKINLDANLDAGGYVWLRKGFWPHEGRKVLDDLVVNSGLSPGVIRDWLDMDDASLQKFTGTDAFRAYKSAFAGSSWKGFGDPRSKDFRDRYLGTAPKAQGLSPKAAAMTANERYRDAVLKYEIDMRRYSSSVQQDLDKFLANQNRLLALELEKRLKALSQDGETVPTFAVTRLRAMMAELSAMREATMDTALQTLTGEMEDFGQLAGTTEVALLGESLPIAYTFAVASPDTLKAIITTEPFQGALMRDWFGRLARRDQDRLQGVVRSGLAQGQTIDQMVQKVAGTKAQGYKDGVLDITRRDARAVVRTAVNHVSNTARNEVWEANADVLPAKVWLSTLDGRTTLICIGRDHHAAPVGPNGKLPPGLSPLDPPDARPPGHWNCLPGNTTITPGSRVTGIFKREFSGELCVINLPGDHKLTCTPNHPVLTDLGWVPAKLLKKGSRIVCHDWGQLPAGVRENEPNYGETSIQEVFHAGLKSGYELRVKSSSSDFHGDIGQGEISIVRPNSSLDLVKLQTPLMEHLHKFGFQGRTSVELTLSGQRCTLLPFDGYGSTPDRLMSFLELADAFLLGSVGPENSVGLPTSPEGNPVLLEPPHYGLATDPKGLPNVGGGFPGKVAFCDAVPFGELEQNPAEGNPKLFQDSANGGTAHPEGFADVVHGFPGKVAFCDVGAVKLHWFTGHVYNLEVKNGYYTATKVGAVVHNCRSTMIAYIHGASLLGERPMVVDTRTRKVREIDFRAIAKAEGKTVQQVRKEWADKHVGNVPASQNYEQFLKNQSKEFQDEILGPTRADMWRSGKLTVDQFTDASGRRYTLKELADKYPQTQVE